MCLGFFIKYAYLLLILVAIRLIYEEVRVKASRNLINIEYLQQCPEAKYADVESPVRDIKMYKLNATVKAFSLRFTLKRPWDQDVGFKMELEIWGYAGWTRVPYIPLQADFCGKYVTMFHTISDVMLKNLGQNLTRVCPFPPGNYAMTNYTSSHAYYFPFKGRFKLRVILMSIKTKQLIMCLVSLINVEEAVLD